MDNDKIVLKLLFEGTRKMAQDAMLRSRCESSNLHKQMGEMLESLVEETCRAEILTWFIENNEEIVDKIKAGPNIFSLPRPVNRGSGQAISRWRRR